MHALIGCAKGRNRVDRRDRKLHALAGGAPLIDILGQLARRWARGLQHPVLRTSAAGLPEPGTVISSRVKDIADLDGRQSLTRSDACQASCLEQGLALADIDCSRARTCR